MKTLVSHPLPQIKLAIDFSGKLTISLPGGKQYEGKLTDEETEQLAFRVHETSKGEVSFDPLPTDLIAVHKSDVLTLEKQAEALEELRSDLRTMAKVKESLNNEKELLESRLSDCEKDLVDARVELKDARILVSELNQKIESESTVHNERAAEPIIETVHNERGELAVIPPSSESSEIKTVHNERSSEPIQTVHNERSKVEGMPLL